MTRKVFKNNTIDTPLMSSVIIQTDHDYLVHRLFTK